MAHLPRLTYMWISTKIFEIDPSLADPQILAALLESDEYFDHYAGQPLAEQHHRSLHGPYDAAHISPGSYQRVTPDIVEAVVTEWARVVSLLPEGLEPELSTPLREHILKPMAAPHATTYLLPELRPRAGHDWSEVVGSAGFHEFVVINRNESQLALIVASDD